MTPEEKAVEHFKTLISNYDFTSGSNYLVKLNPIEIWFIFGKNITAKYNHEMGAWYQIQSRTGDIHGFYWKDGKTKKWVDEEIRKATTCFCGQPDFKRSDGYPSMENCPNGKRYSECKPIEENKFSKLVLDYRR